MISLFGIPIIIQEANLQYNFYSTTYKFNKTFISLMVLWKIKTGFVSKLETNL